MTAYYNEHDPYAAQWLRNLINAGEIAPGDVDERSIEDVRPDEVRGYVQRHWFAGVGVDQKYSGHLWPAWSKPAFMCQPDTISENRFPRHSR